MHLYAQPTHLSPACTSNPQSIVGQCIPNNIKRVGGDKSPAFSGDGRGEVNADIAILGWGVEKHNDLNVYKCISFINVPTIGTTGIEGSCTGTAHDTGAAGIAAAYDNNIGVVGIAPGARIWSINTCSTVNGIRSCQFKDIIDGINYVGKHSDEIEVLNINFASEIVAGNFGGVQQTLQQVRASTQVITEFISKLVEKGVVVVLSAGNTNIDIANKWPSSAEAISVSAITDTDGKCGGRGSTFNIDNQLNGFNIPHQPQVVPNQDDFIASYSNFGLLVDLAAPGTDVITTSVNNGYDKANGTSFAAPAVAGAAALYMWLHSFATPESVKKYLEQTGTKALDPCDGQAKGYFKDTYPAGYSVKTSTDPRLYTGGFPHREPLLNVGWGRYGEFVK